MVVNRLLRGGKGVVESTQAPQKERTTPRTRREGPGPVELLPRRSSQPTRSFASSRRPTMMSASTSSGRNL